MEKCIICENKTSTHNFKINNPSLIKIICEKCGKEISKPNYNSHIEKCKGIKFCLFCNNKIYKGKFCNSSCSAKYNNKNRTRTIKIKEKKKKNQLKYCKQCGAIKGECKRLDICAKKQIFPTLIKYFGFNKSVIGTEKLYEEFERIHNILYEDYIMNELSTLEMQKKYNCLNQRIINSLKNLKIDRRSLSNSTTLAILKGKGKVEKEASIFTRFKTCHHSSWNNKIFFLRSSYELDYALQLDTQQVDYEVELLRIIYWDSQVCKQRIAIPDFFLPQSNTIVEIKGNYTYDEQNMKDKFKAYKNHGYNCKLILNKKEINLN